MKIGRGLTRQGRHDIVIDVIAVPLMLVRVAQTYSGRTL